MSDSFWYALLFATAVYAGLWAFGRWVMPRFHLSDSSLETSLRSEIANLQKRLLESEQKFKELDGKYAAAQMRIADLERNQDWLLEQYRIVGTKATEMERQVDALKRGEPTAEETLPSLIVAIGSDATLRLDLASLRAVRTETGMEFQRIENATLGTLRQYINRARMSGRKFNIHLAVHSGPKGVELGGQVIDSITLSEIFDGCGVLLIAGCESSEVGDFLGVVPYVITIAEKVTHENAAFFSRAFWTAIGKQMPPGPALREALQRAPSGMSEYVTRHW